MVPRSTAPSFKSGSTKADDSHSSTYSIELVGDFAAEYDLDLSCSAFDNTPAKFGVTMIAFAFSILIAVPTPAPAFEEQLSKDDLRQLVLGLYAPIEDVEYRYEGAVAQLQKPDYSKLPKALQEANKKNEGFNNNYGFQGTFAYRNDGAFHLDLFKDYEDPNRPVAREVHSLLDGARSFRGIIPDKGGLTGPDTVAQGHVLGFVKEAFPVLAFSQPIIEQLLNAKSSSIDFRHSGWEKKGGRNCLVLEFFTIDPQTSAQTLLHKYWLDVERNAQPIYIEKYDGEFLDVRVSVIELEYYQTDDGRAAWYPRKGRFQRFRNLFDHSSSPVGEQTFDVLRGTLRINQKLPNLRFILDYGLDESTKLAARKMANAPPKKPRISRDENADEILRKALEEADRQAEPVLVTPPSWLSRNRLTLGLASLGFAGLIAALILQRRSS